MDRENQNNVTMEQIDKIKTQVARLCESAEDCQQAMQLIKEILGAANCTITIDANDIRDSFDAEGTRSVFDVSVNAVATDRMKELIEQIEKNTANNAPIKSLSFHLFFPEDLPLQMSELQPLSDWLSSLQSYTDLKVRWGMAATSHSPELRLRAIVLAVT